MDDRLYRYYYFDKNGNWCIYEMNYNGNVQKYLLRDQLQSNDWFIKDDSILCLGGEEFVVSQKEDSIISIKNSYSAYKLVKLKRDDVVLRKIKLYLLKKWRTQRLAKPYRTPDAT